MKVSTDRNRKNRFSVSLMTSAVAAVGFSTLGGATSALAQETAASATGGDSPRLEEVVVMARRQAENLQDIPVTVQAISGEEIQDLLMTQVSDISKLAAGLNISLSTPTDAVVTLRGVRWTPGSGTPATPVYLNEISFDTAQVIQTMYDVGQVEVLRGPQGTARGAPSISGAVTLTTRRPDLEEMGGYVKAIAGEDDRGMVQGAISIPLIKGKLAARIAGNYDQWAGNRVESLYNSKDPELKNESVRASLRWEPTDNIQIDAMYQRLEQSGGYYTAVDGPGSPGLAPNSPPNFNGPALKGKQLTSVQDLPNKLSDTVQYYTINANWQITDNYNLSYNFGDQDTAGGSATNLDLTNQVPGFDALPDQKTEDPEYNVHEIRLSSIRGHDRFFDFDLGYYYQKFDGVSVFNIPVYLDGAFGDPRTAVPGEVTDPGSRYILGVNGRFTISRTIESFYGSVEMHFTDDTELTLGLRSIDDESSTPSSLAYDPAWQAYVNPVAPIFTCTQLADLSPAAAGTIDSFVYPGLCETPAKPPTSFEGAEDNNTDTIYNISLSHRFSDEVLGYVTTGTSYRGGLPSLNNPGLPSDLILPDPETATSYEIGVKTTWSDWLVVNADVFYIDYEDQLTQFQGIPYWNATTGRENATSVAFFQNVDSEVIGAEVEITAAPIDNLVISTHLSYASIETKGGDVPCDDPTRPLGADNLINTCPIESGKSINASPEFQASINGSYVLPLGAFDGYVRGLISYQNDNENFGTSLEEASSYTTVDLFVGLKSTEGGWDVGLYALNVFDEQVQLRRQASADSFYPSFGPTGYDTVQFNAPREIGMSVQYAFGSR